MNRKSVTVRRVRDVLRKAGIRLRTGKPAEPYTSCLVWQLGDEVRVRFGFEVPFVYGTERPNMLAEGAAKVEAALTAAGVTFVRERNDFHIKEV